MKTTLSFAAAAPARKSVLPQVRRILVATDFSRLSRRGIEAALLLTQGVPEACVEMVHVVEPDSAYGMTDFGVPVHLGPEKQVEEAQEEMDRLQTMLAGHRQLQSRVMTGKVSHTLCDLAREGKFDLLVVSSHGRTGLERVLMGSMAERLVTEAPCPVLVVKPVRNAVGRFLPDAPAPVWREILVGYDHREGAELALNMARTMAGMSRGRITLLHALGPVDTRVALNLLDNPEGEAVVMDEALGELGQVAASHMPEASDWQWRVATGHPWEVLTDYARKMSSDLIVVGPHEHTHWNLQFMGSTAQRVARLAPCAVLVVK